MTRGALPQRRIETQGRVNRKVYKVKETLPTPHVLLVRLYRPSASRARPAKPCGAFMSPCGGKPFKYKASI